MDTRIVSEQKNKTLNALIVEDDLDSLEILTSILEGTGVINCETARTGEQAISYYRENKPHITFLDIDIPEPNGIESLRSIKQMNSKAKVVMVTGCSDIETVKTAVSLGAFAYVVKPYVPEKIIDILKKINAH